MKATHSIAAIVAALGLVAAAPAVARPELVKSSPAAAATASGVKSVALTFREDIVPQQAGLEIVMTGMPGMEGHHPAMKMPGVKVAVGADHRSLIATLPRALPAGTYDVNWHAAGSDLQRATGKVSFTVR